MTTLFSHFLAQALGCASLGNLHNRIRKLLLFRPEHGFSAAQVDGFMLFGSDVDAELSFWADLLSLDEQLLRDAASLARRTSAIQKQRLPALEVEGVGTLANLAPQRHVRVRISIRPAEQAQPEQLARLGTAWLQRDTGYTVADLNAAGAFDRILAVANSHWQRVEQITGTGAEAIAIVLTPESV